MPITAVDSVLLALIAVAVNMPAAGQPRAPRVAQQVGGEHQSVPTGVLNVKSRDRVLTIRITTALRADARIKAQWVGVTASDGHVIMNGHVDSEDAKDAADAIARGVPGVRTLQNDLQPSRPSRAPPPQGPRGRRP